MSYWFMASPYSKYPGGIDAAYMEAATATGHLLKAGIAVYSPIVHSHPVAKLFGLDPCDLGIWLPAEKPKRDAAAGIIMLRAESWEISTGMDHELKEFREAGKPVVWLDTSNPTEAEIRALKEWSKPPEPEPEWLQKKLFNQSLEDIGMCLVTLSTILQQGVRADNAATRSGVACGLERAAAHVRGEKYVPVVDPTHFRNTKGN